MVTRENIGHYSECSVDSDSEAEDEFQQLPKQKQQVKLEKSRLLRQRAGDDKYFSSMYNPTTPPKPDLQNRPKIYRPRNFDRRQANADLAKINEKMAAGENLTPEFLASLPTKFVVAQFSRLSFSGYFQQRIIGNFS